MEEAENDGFGMWQMAPESDHDPEDEDEEDLQRDMELQEEMDEFLDQGESYERDYYFALMGEELAIYNQPHLDPDFDETDGITEGDFFLEDEQPEPSGCRGDLVEEAYGGGQMVTEEFDGEEYSYFEYRPERPTLMTWEEKADAFMSDSTISKQIEFEDCLSDKGVDGWTFDEQGNIDPYMYFQGMYFDDEGFEAEGLYTGPDPDPSLTEYEDIRDHEFELASQFAECNEETGAAEELRQAWLDIEIEELQELESDVVSWQQEMEKALDALQALITE